MQTLTVATAVAAAAVNSALVTVIRHISFQRNNSNVSIPMLLYIFYVHLPINEIVYKYINIYGGIHFGGDMVGCELDWRNIFTFLLIVLLCSIWIELSISKSISFRAFFSSISHNTYTNINLHINISPLIKDIMWVSVLENGTQNWFSLSLISNNRRFKNT